MVFSKDTGGGEGGVKKNVNEPKCLYKKSRNEPRCLFQKNQRTKMFISKKSANQNVYFRKTLKSLFLCLKIIQKRVRTKMFV